MEQRDFFISYAKADKNWAVWVANVLKKNGYSVYIQALDIRPGDNFLEKMEEFLENSSNFIAVWSKSYSKSDYCMNEMRAAFTACHEKSMGCLLPVRIDKHPLRRLYAALVHVDLSDMSAASETELEDAVRDAVPLSNPVLDMDANALFQRGLDYDYGRNGVAQDYAKAREYYEQAAEKGNAPALNYLGILYYYGCGVEVDYAKAREYYEKGAERGDAGALNGLGTLYHNGKGATRDFAKAREYYEQAEAKGNREVLNNLGILYEYGYGVAQDYAKALEYYQKAVDAGYKEAAEYVERVQEKMNALNNPPAPY